MTFELYTLLLPTLVFWLFAGGLHVMGANNHYDGKVTVKEMIFTQFLTDALQLTAGCVNLLGLPKQDNHYRVNVFNVFFGFIIICTWEYAFHRACHNNRWLYQLHKKHHDLVPLHTLGSYYASVGEMLCTGIFLGLCNHFFNLSLLETSMIATIATLLTVYDHWGSTNLKTKTQLRHERHHFYPKCEFGQPFFGYWDWICGTRFQDVYIFTTEAI
jgi:sterol desaturase/sphingolipid hydroxylase (fatty acid hydroxylase superfamily)